MQIPEQRSQSNARAATDPYKRRYANASKKRTAAYRAPAKARKSTTPRASYARKSAMSKRLQVTIPECSIHYIDAIFDPFDTPCGVCIPCDLFPLPSQKVKTTFRGVGNLGTTGYGFVVVNPATVNDIAGVITTTSTSVGGATTALNAFTNTGNGLFTQLPYTAANLVGNTLQTRVVAVGMRVRYSGTEMGRSGLYVACEEQDLGTLNTSTYNQIKDIPNAYTTRPAGDGTWDSVVCYSGPITPGTLEFVKSANPLATAGVYPFAIVMQGVAGDPFEIEIVEHIEYIGTMVQGKTMSHADPTTYGKILETSKSVSAVKTITPDEGPSAFQKFVNSVVQAAPKLINFGVGIATSLATENPLPALAAGAGLLGIGYDRPHSMDRPINARQKQLMYH